MEIKSKFLAILHTNLIKFYPVLLDQKTSIGMCEKISLIVFNILNKLYKNETFILLGMDIFDNISLYISHTAIKFENNILDFTINQFGYKNKYYYGDIITFKTIVKELVFKDKNSGFVHIGPLDKTELKFIKLTLRDYININKILENIRKEIK